MYAAHIGLAITVIGVVLSSNLSVEKNVRLGFGESIEVSGYRFEFDHITDIKGSNFDGVRGFFNIYEGDKKVAVLTPEKRRYRASGQWMTEASIDPGITRDLYVAMGEQLEGSEDWAIRVYVKPFVRCIWLGALFMAFGAFLSILDKRYRSKRLNRLPQKAPAEAA
jgi:cytochrome c-type biogenesis protein CcmF